jgi:hypothetical protein
VGSGRLFHRANFLYVEQKLACYFLLSRLRGTDTGTPSAIAMALMVLSLTTGAVGQRSRFRPARACPSRVRRRRAARCVLTRHRRPLRGLCADVRRKAPRPDSIDTAAPEPEKNDTPSAPQAPEISRGDSEPPNPKRRGRPPRVQQARALLQERLADGPRPGTEIEAAAQAAEITKRELLTACDALDVRSQRGQWWLPVEPT